MLVALLFQYNSDEQAHFLDAYPDKQAIIEYLQLLANSRLLRMRLEIVVLTMVPLALFPATVFAVELIPFVRAGLIDVVFYCSALNFF